MRHVTFFVMVLFFMSVHGQHDTATRINTADSAAFLFLPVFETAGDEGEAGAPQQEISALLQGSRDVFVQLATFQFAAAGFRMRSMPGDFHRVMINGVDLGNPETGYAGWSSWGGLNDVTKQTDGFFGNGPNRYGFAGPAGYTNIFPDAAHFRKSTRAAYSAGNRVFKHRFSLSGSSGLSRRGWAFTAALSMRTGDEVNVSGTYFRALSTFFSIERRINYRHSIALTSFFAPVEQGRQNAAVREVFDLTGNPDYNSSWGYQNGKVRNAGVTAQSKPTAMITHHYKRNDVTRASASVCYQGGVTSRTRLNYSDAGNPRPDYYRYLPSYYYHIADTANGARTAAQWATQGPVTQISWDEMIAANRANLYSAGTDTGQVNTTDTRARYLLEKMTEKQSMLALAGTVQHKARSWYLSGGVSHRIWEARKFRIAEDLLGATFWIDEDQFADGTGVDEMVKQNDIERPGRKVLTGEKFGYDYSIHVRKAEVWSQAEYTRRRWELFVAGSASWQQAFRIGHIANGKFPAHSKGKSDVSALPGFGARTGVTFKLSSRQYFSFCASAIKMQPAPSNIFVSPAVRNDLVQGLESSAIFSGDATYNIRMPGLRSRITAYATSLRDQLWLRTFWHDEYNATVNMIMKDVNYLYSGLEIAVEKQISNQSLTAGASIARAVYRGRPKLEAWQDNNREQLFSERTVYLNNYAVGSTPQFVAGLTYKINGRRSWFAAAGCNYLDHIYSDVNPVRRTAEAAGKFAEDEKNIAASVTGQERLPAWWLFNASVFKAFRLKNQKWIGCTMSMMNLLGTRVLSRGFEQLRWDPAKPDLFPAKYTYSQPRTFMISITYNT